MKQEIRQWKHNKCTQRFPSATWQKHNKAGWLSPDGSYGKKATVLGTKTTSTDVEQPLTTEEHKAYRRAVGKLRWITYTQPGISYATKELARSLTQPTILDQQKLKHILSTSREHNTTGSTWDQLSEQWARHRTSTSSWTRTGQDALQHRSQPQGLSSSSWDQQSTSAAAHKQQLHSAAQKQNYMPSTQEQQNHSTSGTSYRKRSTSRKSTSEYTQTLRAGRAWQKGLDHRRKPNTSSSNISSSNNSCSTNLWGLSRSTQQTTPRTSSPSTWPPRRSWGISRMLGSQPSITSRHRQQQEFHRSVQASVHPRVHVRTTCVAYTHTHTNTHFWAMVLTKVNNTLYIIEISILQHWVYSTILPHPSSTC